MHPDADPRNFFSEGEIYADRSGSRFVILGFQTNGDLDVTDPDDQHHQSSRAWSWTVDPWQLYDDIKCNRVRKVGTTRQPRNEWFPEI